ncbi:hypothetical protein ABK040_013377 [Willaertia magna]
MHNRNTTRFYCSQPYLNQNPSSAIPSRHHGRMTNIYENIPRDKQQKQENRFVDMSLTDDDWIIFLNNPDLSEIKEKDKKEETLQKELEQFKLQLEKYGKSFWLQYDKENHLNTLHYIALHCNSTEKLQILKQHFNDQSFDISLQRELFGKRNNDGKNTLFLFLKRIINENKAPNTLEVKILNYYLTKFIAELSKYSIKKTKETDEKHSLIDFTLGLMEKNIDELFISFVNFSDNYIDFSISEFIDEEDDNIENKDNDQPFQQQDNVDYSQYESYYDIKESNLLIYLIETHEQEYFLYLFLRKIKGMFKREQIEDIYLENFTINDISHKLTKVLPKFNLPLGPHLTFDALYYQNNPKHREVYDRWFSFFICYLSLVDVIDTCQKISISLQSKKNDLNITDDELLKTLNENVMEWEKSFNKVLQYFTFSHELTGDNLLHSFLKSDLLEGKFHKLSVKIFSFASGITLNYLIGGIKSIALSIIPFTSNIGEKFAITGVKDVIVRILGTRVQSLRNRINSSLRLFQVRGTNPAPLLYYYFFSNLQNVLMDIVKTNGSWFGRGNQPGSYSYKDWLKESQNLMRFVRLRDNRQQKKEIQLSVEEKLKLLVMFYSQLETLIVKDEILERKESTLKYIEGEDTFVGENCLQLCLNGNRTTPSSFHMFLLFILPFFKHRKEAINIYRQWRRVNKTNLKGNNENQIEKKLPQLKEGVLPLLFKNNSKLKILHYFTTRKNSKGNAAYSKLGWFWYSILRFRYFVIFGWLIIGLIYFWLKIY